MFLVVAFIAGCIAAQLGWSLLAADAAALGAPTFRFMMLAAIEIVVAAVAFTGAMFAAARSSEVMVDAKSCAVAFFAGALTLTVAGAPYSLVPRIVQGEAQLVILIGVAAVVSAFLGALVGAAFRAPTPP
ncbi:MAG TPA: hypothetical protein VM073_00220 [Usitatibacter sp.]|nr:hypothetical protein [Usitatibacter sp.]